MRRTELLTVMSLKQFDLRYTISVGRNPHNADPDSGVPALAQSARISGTGHVP